VTVEGFDFGPVSGLQDVAFPDTHTALVHRLRPELHAARKDAVDFDGRQAMDVDVLFVLGSEEAPGEPKTLLLVGKVRIRYPQIECPAPCVEDLTDCVPTNDTGTLVIGRRPSRCQRPHRRLRRGHSGIFLGTLCQNGCDGTDIRFIHLGENRVERHPGETWTQGLSDLTPAIFRHRDPDGIELPPNRQTLIAMARAGAGDHVEFLLREVRTRRHADVLVDGSL